MSIWWECWSCDLSFYCRQPILIWRYLWTGYLIKVPGFAQTENFYLWPISEIVTWYSVDCLPYNPSRIMSTVLKATPHVTRHEGMSCVFYLIFLWIDFSNRKFRHYKTAVSSVHLQWRYCRLALSYRYLIVVGPINVQLSVKCWSRY